MESSAWRVEILGGRLGMEKKGGDRGKILFIIETEILSDVMRVGGAVVEDEGEGEDVG